MMKKIALVTGASSGLGEAIARIFREKGFKVIAVCRSEPRIELDCWIQADVTQKSVSQEILDKVNEKFGRLDILINAAGKGNCATWEEFDEVQLRDLFELDFFALVNMTYAFLPLLKKSKGTIVNISSIAGKVYIPCMGPYSAAKHALAAFSGSLRVELKNSGVKVISIFPGHIDTGFSNHSIGPREFPYISSFGGSASGLARRLYKAYQRNWHSFMYPRAYIVIVALAKTFPRIYDWISRKIWKLND